MQLSVRGALLPPCRSIAVHSSMPPPCCPPCVPEAQLAVIACRHQPVLLLGGEVHVTHRHLVRTGDLAHLGQACRKEG